MLVSVHNASLSVHEKLMNDQKLSLSLHNMSLSGVGGGSDGEVVVVVVGGGGGEGSQYIVNTSQITQRPVRSRTSCPIWFTPSNAIRQSS